MHVTKNRTTGFLLCITGAGIIAASHIWEFRQDWITIVCFLVIAAGAYFFLSDTFRSLVYLLKGPGDLHRDDSAVIATALIRCMVAVSVADDHLDDNEVQTIRKIYEKLMGTNMPEETIRDAAAHLQEQGVDIAAEMAHVKDIFNKDLKEKLVKASLYILAADGVMDEKEEEILEEIVKGLGLSKAKYQKLKTGFLEKRDLI